MGSPISLVVANLYMEEFEAQALSTSPNPARIWLRYVDDTLFIRQNTPNCSLPTLITSIPTDSLQSRSLPFLDTLVSVDSNGSLITTVFRKPTHMDQYLHWDSHHSITNKYSVYIQHTYTQSLNCLFKPAVIGTGIPAHQNCPLHIHVPRLGLPQTPD